MSSDHTIECRICGESGLGYSEYETKYHAELCHNKECRYFWSEENGKVVSEGVMEMNEYEEHSLSPYATG